MELLKQTGDRVKLTIIRYLRGLKFEELQAGISLANVDTPTGPFPLSPANSTLVQEVDNSINKAVAAANNNNADLLMTTDDEFVSSLPDEDVSFF